MNINSRFEHVEKCMQVKTDYMGEHTLKNVAREFNTRIIVNELPAYEVVCTPDELEFLSIGRLVSEGVIKDKEDIEAVYVCDTGAVVKVYTRKTIDLGETSDMIKVATCCTDNISHLKERILVPVVEMNVSDEDINTLVEMFEKNFPLYDKTHAVHSAVIMHKGKIICHSEDIGRHNAIDKVIGKALYHGINLSEVILFTSGRVPTDMARKAIMAGIPCLVAKGAPTYESVVMAQKYNLKLITNASKKGYNKF